MTNIDQLFCTPEQGRRLAELVPDLTSAFVWYRMHDDYKVSANNMIHRHLYPPALTLQELRDVVKKANLDMIENAKTFLLDSFDYHELENLLDVGTAPELAAWVIERLEEVER